MKVLLVAPQQLNLKFQQPEVQRLVNVLNAKVVIGDVSIDDVTGAIAEYKPDVLWFSSHGERNGIHLSKDLIDGDMLSSAIRGTNTRLVVINSCASRDVAERIYSATGAHVIATVGEVDDRHAFVTAQRFAVLLSTGLEPYEAYTKAKTPTFIYVPDMSTHNPNSNGNGNGYEQLRRIVAELQMQVDRRDLIIDQLRAEISSLMLEFTKFRQEQESRYRSTQNSQWLLILMVVIVLLSQLSQVLQ